MTIPAPYTNETLEGQAEQLGIKKIHNENQVSLRRAI